MTGTTEPCEASIHSATAGDPVAIDQVLRAYLPRLQRFVHLRLSPQLRAREDTLDIVQSTVRELLAQPSFEWRGEVEFRAWLFQAALHKILEKHRFHAAQRRDSQREVALDVSASAFGGQAVQDLLSPSRIASAKEDLARLEAAFDRLTDPQREVLALARVAGLPHELIARRLGKSEVAVRQLLVRAMVAIGAAFRTE